MAVRRWKNLRSKEQTCSNLSGLVWEVWALAAHIRLVMEPSGLKQRDRAQQPAPLQQDCSVQGF